MKLVIEYEASWRNSFLDGSNNECLPKDGRNFIGSMTNLKKQGNFIKREVTKDTVMGLLNRLIGDQRKLYQSRNDANYYFSNLEKAITFEDKPRVNGISNEVIYLRNIKGSTDQNSFSGILKTQDAMFSSDYSSEFWSILWMDFNELCQFIVNDYCCELRGELDPLSICDRFEQIGKLKPMELADYVEEALKKIKDVFPDENYFNNKGLILPGTFYCSALYLQLERLSNKYDMSSARTKQGGIGGISKRSFTKKDFMKKFTTGNGKLIFGNPYLLKEKIKGEGEVTSMLTKVSGQLEIFIDVDSKKGREIEQLIENAGVSSFYLGKKGLAFVRSIDPRETRRDYESLF